MDGFGRVAGGVELAHDGGIIPEPTPALRADPPETGRRGDRGTMERELFVLPFGEDPCERSEQGDGFPLPSHRRVRYNQANLPAGSVNQGGSQKGGRGGGSV